MEASQPRRELWFEHLHRSPVLVESERSQAPFLERLFVLTNRLRNAVKLLYRERSGFCLWQKRVERERFKGIRQPGGEAVVLVRRWPGQ